LADISYDDIITNMRPALERIQKGQTFSDWLQIGHALNEADQRAMHALGINEPNSKKLKNEKGRFLKESGLGRYRGSVRSCAQSCARNMPEIVAWRTDHLDDNRRAALNHPVNNWKLFSHRDKPKGEPRKNKKDEQIEELQAVIAEKDAANKNQFDTIMARDKTIKELKEGAGWDGQAELNATREKIDTLEAESRERMQALQNMRDTVEQAKDRIHEADHRARVAQEGLRARVEEVAAAVKEGVEQNLQLRASHMLVGEEIEASLHASLATPLLDIMRMNSTLSARIEFRVVRKKIDTGELAEEEDDEEPPSVAEEPATAAPREAVEPKKRGGRPTDAEQRARIIAVGKTMQVNAYGTGMGQCPKCRGWAKIKNWNWRDHPGDMALSCTMSGQRAIVPDADEPKRRDGRPTALAH
jgi:hypothetical protein